MSECISEPREQPYLSFTLRGSRRAVQLHVVVFSVLTSHSLWLRCRKLCGAAFWCVMERWAAPSPAAHVQIPCLRSSALCWWGSANSHVMHQNANSAPAVFHTIPLCSFAMLRAQMEKQKKLLRPFSRQLGEELHLTFKPCSSSSWRGRATRERGVSCLTAFCFLLCKKRAWFC